MGESAGRHLAAEFANCRLQDVDVDIERFERLARSSNRSELLAAAELYRGEFLADFVINSEPFQEWLAVERDRTLDLICSVLQRLTALQDEAGEHDAAIQSARRSGRSRLALGDWSARADPRLCACGEAAGSAAAVPDLRRNPEARTRGRSRRRNPGARERDSAFGRQPANRPLLPPRRTAGPWTARGADALDRLPAKPAIHCEPAAPIAKTTRLRWPCLLPNIAVAVAPVRNLTGDPDQQYLVEAFYRRSRHRSSAPRPRAGARAGSRTTGGQSMCRPGSAEPEIEYVVTGSAQRSGPRTLRVNMQISNAATAEYCWADRYEFDPEDLEPIQTKITRRISRELHLLALASRRAAVR